MNNRNRSNISKTKKKDVEKFFETQNQILKDEFVKIKDKLSDHYSIKGEIVPNKKFIDGSNFEEEIELTKKELIGRAKDLGRENIKLLYGIIKVIGLTTATIVLLNILTEYKGADFDFSEKTNFFPNAILHWHWYNKENLIFDAKIFCWISTCMVLILTYDAGMFATIFLHRIMDEFELILVFSFVVFEFFLFALLYHKFFIDDKNYKLPHFASLWLVIYGIYTLLVGVLALVHRSKVGKLKLYDKMINADLRKHYASDFVETMTVGIINLGLGIRSFFYDPVKIEYHRFIFINTLIPVFFIILAYKFQYFKRRKITNKLIHEKRRSTILDKFFEELWSLFEKVYDYRRKKRYLRT